MPLRLALAVSVMLLTACATRPAHVPGAPDWQRHSARIAALDWWAVEGKVGLRSPERSDSASLVWQQEGTLTRLQLGGPFGLGAVTIVGEGRHLVLTQGEEITHWDIADLEGIAQKTGWNLPLQALPHWLRGLPAPGSKVQSLVLDDTATLLQTLRQDGWEIHYQEYASFDGFSLPTRLAIERDGTRARLLIRQWSFPPAR